MKTQYSKCDVERILSAYREMFPSIGPELRRYWDLDRKQEWSLLTTDFHAVDYDTLVELSVRTEKINREFAGARAKAHALADAARNLGSGFSIGVSPWTDHGLFSTYEPAKDKITVVVAHDWYPIVPMKEHPRDMPLFAQGLATMTGAVGAKYHKAVPPQLLSDGGDRVLLFLNLYPHYREPEDGLTGKLAVDYGECFRGLLDVLECVCTRFNDVQLISWGTHTWEQVRKLVEGKDKTNLSDNWLTGGESAVHTIRVGGRPVRYLPLAHPSHPGNFCTKGPIGHLAHVQRGFAALGS